MACTVSSSALTSIAAVLTHMQKTFDDIRTDGFRFYVIGTGGSTAATVQIDRFNNRMQVIITAGTDAGTHNYDLATYTTLAALKTAVEADIDAEFTVLVNGSQLTADLPDFAATGCLGVSNEVTIPVWDTCLLAELINAASELVERTTGRRFAQATYTRQLRADHMGRVMIEHWPVTAVNWLADTTRVALVISNTDSTAVHKLVSVDTAAGKIRLSLVGGSNDGTAEISIGSSVSVSQAVTTILLTAGSDNWSAEAGSGTNVGNLPTSWLFDMGATDCGDHEVEVLAAGTPISGYSTEHLDAGYVELHGCYANRLVWTQYVAGYSTVPADVVLVVNDAVKEMLGAIERDTTLQSERLGDYEYVNAIAQQTDIPDRIVDRLRHYMLPIS